MEVFQHTFDELLHNFSDILHLTSTFFTCLHFHYLYIWNFSFSFTFYLLLIIITLIFLIYLWGYVYLSTISSEYDFCKLMNFIEYVYWKSTANKNKIIKLFTLAHGYPGCKSKNIVVIIIWRNYLSNLLMPIGFCRWFYNLLKE